MLPPQGATSSCSLLILQCSVRWNGCKCNSLLCNAAAQGCHQHYCSGLPLQAAAALVAHMLSCAGGLLVLVLPKLPQTGKYAPV